MSEGEDKANPCEVVQISPVALSIAGLDPSGGAGITADLKTFSAHKLYGICAPTALTVQSTRGVRRVVPVDAELLSETLQCLCEDIPPAGVKIGMLGTAGIAEAVADFLASSGIVRECTVLDPVLRSSSGAALLNDAGVRVVRERLMGQIGWITPNTDELAALLNEPVADAEGIPAQAVRLQQLAERAGNRHLRVVVTGGHLEKPDDYFLDSVADRAEGSSEKAGVWLSGERVVTTSTHGTGCAFSSALVCQLIAGSTGEKAVSRAKAYVTGALRHAYPIGGGKGPLNHFFETS